MKKFTMFLWGVRPKKGRKYGGKQQVLTSIDDSNPIPYLLKTKKLAKEVCRDWEEVFKVKVEAV